MRLDHDAEIVQYRRMLPTVWPTADEGKLVEAHLFEGLPEDPPDRELHRSYINSAFLLPDGAILTTSLQTKRLKVMMSSERGRFGIAECTTADEVLQVGKLRDAEASRLRHEIHVLDLRRSRVDPPTSDVTAKRWEQAHNRIQELRRKQIALVGEAPVGMARNRGAGGRPATWATAVFARTQVIADALHAKPVAALRALFAHLEDSGRTRTFLKRMIERFRQWRHRQRDRATPSGSSARIVITFSPDTDPRIFGHHIRRGP